MKRKSLETSNHRPEFLNGIMGLKAICMLFLFWWHSTIPHPAVDLGARTCEFLFVASGFLVGYNGFTREIPDTWTESCRHVWKKFIAFWPLHFITMLLVWFVAGTPPFITKKNLFDAFLNLSLLQAWSPYKAVCFSFNGTTWFLSALMFCYFLSPFLLKLSKRLRTSVLLFLLTFTVRYVLECVVKNNPDEYWMISVHTSPLVRSLEFFLGMLIVPLFLQMKEHLKVTNDTWWMSIVEVITILGLVFLTIRYQGFWPRSIFVGSMCVTVFVFSFDKGIISRILGCRVLKAFSCIQFEFFILHQAVMTCLNGICKKIFPDWRLLNAFMFLTIVVLAFIYNRVFRKRCSACLEKCARFCIGVLKLA